LISRDGAKQQLMAERIWFCASGTQLIPLRETSDTRETIHVMMCYESIINEIFITEKLS